MELIFIIVFTAIVTVLTYFINDYYRRKDKKLYIEEVMKAVRDKEIVFYAENHKIYVRRYQDTGKRFEVGEIEKTDDYKKGYEQGEKDMLRSVGDACRAIWGD